MENPITRFLLITFYFIFYVKLFSVKAQSRVFTDPNIPLTAIDVKGDFIDFVGKITLTQQYKNNYDRTIESIYQFNLDDASTVTAMTMILGNRRLSSVIKEKNQARQEYTKAIEEKKTTGLLEKGWNGIYKMNVGNIAAGQEITIEITYITILPSADHGEMRFVLPTNIGLKYDGSSFQTEKDIADKAATTSQLVYKGAKTPKLFSFNLNLTWSSNYRIEEVKSFTNEISVNGINEKKVNIQSTIASAKGDFILVVRTKEIGPTIYVRKEVDNTYLMLNHRIGDEAAPELLKTDQLKEKDQEYIILLDRSGSMGDTMTYWSGGVTPEPKAKSKIDYAREAGLLFVQSLPPGCKFNVISYGSKYSSLFPNSVPNTKQYRQQASKELSKFAADFGGTELAFVLRDLFTDNLVKEGEDGVVAVSKRSWTPKPLLRENPKSAPEKIIILITDAEVTSNDAIISLVKQYRAHHRIFTVGIGQDVNRFLCKEIARVSNAYSEILIDHPNIGSVVQKMIESSRKSYYRNTKLLVNGKEIIFEKNIYPNIFTSLYYRLPTREWLQTTSIKVQSTNGITGELKTWILQIPPHNKPAFEETDSAPSVMIRQLYAIDLIRELEEKYRGISEGNWTKEVIELSVKYQVMSPRTSFLVIDEEINPKIEEKPISVNVPQFLNKNTGSGVMGAGLPSKKFSRGAIPAPTANDDTTSFNDGDFLEQMAGLRHEKVHHNSAPAPSSGFNPFQSILITLMIVILILGGGGWFFFYMMQSRKSFEKFSKL